MIKLLVVFFGVAYTSLALGQSQILFTEARNLSFEISEQAGRLVVQIPEKYRAGKWLTALDIRLDDADLVLAYALANTREKDFYYRLSLTLETEEGRMMNPRPEQLAGYTDRLPATPESAGQIVWMDVTEGLLFYGRRYTLNVTVTLWGDPDINCLDPRPEFSMRQQWPHYVGAAVGLGLIGIGHIYKNQSDQDYSVYEQYWQAPRSEDDAQPFYQTAQDNRQTHRNLTYAGLAVIGIDALWYTYRLLRIRSLQNRYERYCAPDQSLGWSPVLLLPGPEGRTGMGVAMNWRF